MSIFLFFQCANISTIQAKQIFFANIPSMSLGSFLVLSDRTPFIYPGPFCSTVVAHPLHSQNMVLSSETSPLLLPPPPDVLISGDSYAGQILGLMMDNLPKVGMAHSSAASLWMPYGQKQLFSLLSFAQMCQTGCRLQSAVLLALGGGCFLLAW